MQFFPTHNPELAYPSDHRRTEPVVGVDVVEHYKGLAMAAREEFVGQLVLWGCLDVSGAVVDLNEYEAHLEGRDG